MEVIFISAVLKFRRRKCTRLFVVVPICLFAILFLLYKCVLPAFASAAEIKLSILADELMNEAALCLSPALFDGTELVAEGSEGDAGFISLNTDRLNALRGEYLNALFALMSDREKMKISVPAGSLTGNIFLSGRGPCISVYAMPLGSAGASFESGFSSAGINQTKHTVYMRVSLSLYALSPFACSIGRELVIPVCETVTVGTVPLFYSN